MKIAIITDSTCDWPVEDYAARDVTMVPLRICFGAQSFLDQREIASEEFYDRMIGASDLPSTSQPSPGDFAREFERLAAEGYEGALCMHIARPLSGTQQSVEIAAQNAPIPVKVVDSCVTTAALGLMVDAACDLRDEGVDDLEELSERVEAFGRKIRIFLLPETLENLVRGGRLPAEAAEQMGLLNIRLILTLAQDGSVVPFDKAKGLKGAVARCVDAIAAYEKEHGAVSVRYVHTRNEAAVEKLADALRDAGVTVAKSHVHACGATIATHLGMGAACVAVAPVQA